MKRDLRLKHALGSHVPARRLATAQALAHMGKRAPMEKRGAHGKSGAKARTVRF